MSLSTALSGLNTTHSQLADAVTELVMNVHDDRPRESEVAIVEDLADTVSELQGDVAQAGEALRSVTDARLLPARMAVVDEAIARATLRYWRDLRGHTPVAQLRSTAHGRGSEWHSWQRSLEVSELRCEAPLVEAAASVRSAWHEIGELLALSLPTTFAPADGVGGETRPIISRRTS